MVKETIFDTSELPRVQVMTFSVPLLDLSHWFQTQAKY